MTFNSIAIAFIAIVLVLFTIILPMVDKVKSDFATVTQTLENG